MFWTVDDFNAGRCSLADVGNLKPEPEAAAAVAPIAPEDKRTLRERLRDDALQAYHDLGGVEYLKKNPELLDKMLAKAIPPEQVVAQTNVALVPDSWPCWIKPTRLRYSHDVQIADDIRRAESLPPPSAEPETAPAALPESASGPRNGADVPEEG